jgi:hypothetical protein
MTFMDCQNFLRLYNGLKSRVNLNDYDDESWCENYTAEEYFLYVLCWAGWNPERQANVWKEVRDRFRKSGKHIHTYLSADVEKLCDSYPLPWQKKWVKRLVDFLEGNLLTAQNFIDQLRAMGYENARRKLQEIVATDAEKIVDCWLRDIVRLDAFPIDTRTRGLLRKYGIPVNSSLIIDCCKKNNIPIRPFARAVYEQAEALKKSIK